MESYERIKEIREQKGLSLPEVARVLNVSEKRLYEWECGRGAMPTHCYIKLAVFYDLSLDYISGLNDTPRKLREQ